MNVKTPLKMLDSVISSVWVGVAVAYVLGKDLNAKIHLGVINASAQRKFSPDQSGNWYFCIVSDLYLTNLALSGYKLDMMTRKKCYDRNECKYNDGRGPCDHECKNTEGSFLCRCDPGYELGEDNTSCNDIQECAVENGGCSHTCVEEQGSYQCECPEGYELGSNDATCVDVDECYNGSHGCSYACSNYDGGYQCSCKRGQKLDVDQKTCIDINEVKLSRD